MREALLEDAYAAWRNDIASGRTAVMVAASNEDVAALSARARLDRVNAGQVEPDGVVVADGNRAGVGDWVVTRQNQRALDLFGGRDFVKNGDLWTVSARHADGSLDVTHLGHGGRVRIPADYVAEHVELAYATTAHRAQGATVDKAHALVTATTSRETLYVAATRARHATTLYVATDETFDVDTHPREGARSARNVLEQVLAQQGAEKSATETIRDAHAAAERLRAATRRLSPEPSTVHRPEVSY